MADKGVEVLGEISEGFDEILTDDALAFVAALTRQFGPTIDELLAARTKRQEAIDAGEMPDFLEETREIRESEWTVTDVPEDLTDRRVEITGPTDRKMIINALNSGAKVFMADCEDYTKLMPSCFGTSGSVRTSAKIQSAYCAPEVQIF